VPEGNVAKRIGQMAVDNGLMTPEELTEALAEHQHRLAAGSRVPFGELLVELEYISRRQLKRLLTAQGVRKSPRQRFPGFELIKMLGEGGMGTTYLARQISMKRLVAIKVLRAELSRNKQYVERFRREARLAGQLDHPNIAQAMDVGEAGGLHYIVMEYVEGRPVTDLIPEGGYLDERFALHVILQVARALQAGHKHGIVHRDIKPDNILVTRERVAKLCDFGLAKQARGESHLTKAGMAVGTPHYVSPEQAQGEIDVDIRSDIYALGASLFHLVTGRLPYDAENPAAVAIKHITDPVPKAQRVNPRVSDGCDRMISKMMAKHPSQRYQTPAELIKDMQQVMAGRAIGIQVLPVDAGTGGAVGRSAGKPPRTESEARRRRARASTVFFSRSWSIVMRRFRPVIGLAVAALVGLIVYYSFFRERRPPLSAVIRTELHGAEKWWRENPKDYDGAVQRLKGVLEKARGTSWEERVREAIAEVERARKSGAGPEPGPPPPGD
jgi:serine/threonine-protein kinase